MTEIIVAGIAAMQAIIITLVTRSRRDAKNAAEITKGQDIHHTAIEWKLDQLGREIGGIRKDVRHLQDRFDTHIDTTH